MNQSELKDKLKSIIIEVTHSSDDAGDIADDDFLIDDLGIDSLGMMTLVETLEKRFSIVIPVSEVVLDNFKTVELLLKYVTSKLGSMQ
jgi:acyl carrier protein